MCETIVRVIGKTFFPQNCSGLLCARKNNISFSDHHHKMMSVQNPNSLTCTLLFPCIWHISSMIAHHQNYASNLNNISNPTQKKTHFKLKYPLNRTALRWSEFRTKKRRQECQRYNSFLLTNFRLLGKSLFHFRNIIMIMPKPN